ncbi:hypothetical protein AYI70_g10110 [Smittium culicis]|uniref:Uncharacterized protein n=1 Tax=Smittium culicis TaxID=133412 RepID=A0A1R1X836_9FUNG|nr:hypothetical protein AYI70_g10110 [Smittium culicis]
MKNPEDLQVISANGRNDRRRTKPNLNRMVDRGSLLPNRPSASEIEYSPDLFPNISKAYTPKKTSMALRNLPGNNSKTILSGLDNDFSLYIKNQELNNEFGSTTTINSQESIGIKNFHSSHYSSRSSSNYLKKKSDLSKAIRSGGIERLDSAAVKEIYYDEPDFSNKDLSPKFPSYISTSSTLRSPHKIYFSDKNLHSQDHFNNPSSIYTPSKDQPVFTTKHAKRSSFLYSEIDIDSKHSTNKNNNINISEGSCVKDRMVSIGGEDKLKNLQKELNIDTRKNIRKPTSPLSANIKTDSARTINNKLGSPLAESPKKSSKAQLEINLARQNQNLNSCNYPSLDFNKNIEMVEINSVNNKEVTYTSNTELGINLHNHSNRIIPENDAELTDSNLHSNKAIGSNLPHIRNDTNTNLSSEINLENLDYRSYIQPNDDFNANNPEQYTSTENNFRTHVHPKASHTRSYRMNRIRIQRDYFQGDLCRFQESIPLELKSKVLTH